MGKNVTLMFKLKKGTKLINEPLSKSKNNIEIVHRAHDLCLCDKGIYVLHMCVCVSVPVLAYMCIKYVHSERCFIHRLIIKKIHSNDSILPSACSRAGIFFGPYSGPSSSLSQFYFPCQIEQSFRFFFSVFS